MYDIESLISFLFCPAVTVYSQWINMYVKISRLGDYLLTNLFFKI